MDLTAALIRELLDYCPDTGVLTWRVTTRHVKAGAVAGGKNYGGYIHLSIRGHRYLAHKVAWAHFYGEWPTSRLDHINRNRSDNRILNLRLATVSENNFNRSRYSRNTSGHTGVHWHRARRKWCARVAKNGHRQYLGLFSNKEDAVAAYSRAAVEAFGCFAPK